MWDDGTISAKKFRSSGPAESCRANISQCVAFVEWVWAYHISTSLIRCCPLPKLLQTATHNSPIHRLIIGLKILPNNLFMWHYGTISTEKFRSSGAAESRRAKIPQCVAFVEWVWPQRLISSQGRRWRAKAWISCTLRWAPTNLTEARKQKKGKVDGAKGHFTHEPEPWPWNCESPEESVQRPSQHTSKLM